MVLRCCSAESLGVVVYNSEDSLHPFSFPALLVSKMGFFESGQCWPNSSPPESSKKNLAGFSENRERPVLDVF